jgi:RNA polymerase sigma-70 factor (ECF subfamily)
MPNSSKLELDTVRILISRVRDGDESARGDLAIQVQSYLSMMADRNLNDQVRGNVGPSDVVQLTLMKMVDGIDNFRGNSTPEFYGWLNGIVKNEARKVSRDLTRKKRDIRRQQSIDDQEKGSRGFGGIQAHEVTPQSSALAKERIELFHLALSRLSDDYATVIRLRNLEQLSFNDIAVKMNRTVNAVSKIWHRAILKFEQELELLNEQSRQ